MKRQGSKRFLVAGLLAVMCTAPISAQVMSNKKQELLRSRDSDRIVSQWQTRIKRMEALILKGKSAKALENGTRLAAEMVNMITSGESGQILGVVNILRALAAYNIGDERQALWHWQTGLQMFPGLAEVDLKRFGDAFEFLSRNPPRNGEAIEDANPQQPLEKSEKQVTKPVKKHAPLPMFPCAKLGSEPLQVVVSAIIDTQGRPTSPRIVQADGEFSLICASLEAFWKWEFEPATFEGEPVPVYYNLAINFRTKGRP